jgi:hypothetical protein
MSNGIACWDHLKCSLKTECPAYPDNGFACWNIAGILCRGERQPDYDEKVGSCRLLCSFYNGVMTGSIRVT